MNADQKISIDKNALLAIAEEIHRNCDMLSYTYGEYAEDDVETYVPVIHELADELLELMEQNEA